MCTSGKKHETLPRGVFEYADFKNCGNHDVTPTVPAQKLKIQNGRLEQVFFVNNLALSAPIAMICVFLPTFVRSKNPIRRVTIMYIYILIIIY